MPSRVYKEWREQHGLHDFTPESLAEHYERVEQVLGVTPAASHLLGAGAQAVARGCDALGYEHAPLRRNAPDCDGQGVCCFGCPTDAKRSTNVSYIPAALRAGAQLFSEAHAERIVIEHGRAVGVVARAVGQHGHQVTVRARAVVLAAGALLTPVLLQRQSETRRLLARSGQLGRNLSIHPAAAVFALMPQRVRGAAGIPQGYAIEEFHDEGLLMEGVYTPLDLGAATLTPLGPLFTAAMTSIQTIRECVFARSFRTRRVSSGDSLPEASSLSFDASKPRISLREWLSDRELRRITLMYPVHGASRIFPPLSSARA